MRVPKGGGKMDVLARGKEEVETLTHKLTIYHFLQKFYAGELNKISGALWKQLSGLINDEASYFSNEKMRQGIENFSLLEENDVEEIEFDYNRLFVGPNRLEVSPYESTYRNTERAIMQGETLAVRRFYERAGLVVNQKNIEPDDHLAIELEFICYLLENSLEDEENYVLYEYFLKKHLFQWVEVHCELIREKAKNKLLLGISYLLQGLMEIEREQLNVRRR
ncbi:molecular chaperone TorD family protein [Cytobacillus spongiae]|jgi:TorA maturation chaperone TorD|uniref:TorD/DmsD family molecular chaperone n=1 Tax=Cytobacillus spongiae TaxID=2901381 RepID=UPI001F2B3F4D|nr:molecular chaperone TorD family protein [Cytobacillus spongiae]UII56381.1 molecular chaperone TorD family protein [Cytobacillus spongiae]